MAFCGNCGAQLNDGDKFCPQCGKAVDDTSSDSEQEFDEEQEDTLTLWKKILYFLVGPVGILASLIYYFRKKVSMAKSAFLWGAIGTALWFAVPKIMNYNEPEHTTKSILVDEFFNKKRVFLDITKITLLHKGGNEYTGFVECIINGESTRFDVDVIYDGSDVLVEWEWPDVCSDDSDD